MRNYPTDVRWISPIFRWLNDPNEYIGDIEQIGEV